MSRIDSATRSRLHRMLAGLSAGVVAVAASVLGAALPASANTTASISGTVTSDLDGSGVAAVRVTVYSDDGSGSLAPITFVETASDGTYTLQNLPAGLVTLGFLPGDDDHLSRWLGNVTNPFDADRLTLGEGEALTGVDAVLQRTGSMSGTVTDAATGEPIEDVEVRAIAFTEEGGYVGSATTGADGSYVMTGLLPDNRWEVTFDGEALGYIEELWVGPAPEFASFVTVVAGETTADIDAELDRESTISGTVERLSQPGVGVEGVDITVFSDFGDVLSATTAADGTYTVTGLATGNYTVRASGPSDTLTEWYDNVFDGFNADVIAITQSGSEITGIDFALDGPGTITGTITDADGVPMEGVVVEAQPLGDAEFLSTATDANGFYELIGVAPVDYRIYAFADPFVNVVPQFFPGVSKRADAEIVTGALSGAVTGIDFELPEGAIISGTVTAEGSGAPLFDIEVVVESEEFDIDRSVYTDDNGDWTMRGLPTGDDYTVRFIDGNDTYLSEFYEDSPRRSGATPVALQQGSTTANIDAALTAAASIAGRVVDEQGNGIADVQVYVAFNGLLDDRVTEYFFTDSNGEFTADRLRPGDYRVLVSDIYNAQTVYRSEWFENQYDPLTSGVVTLAAGENLTGFDVELIAIDDPEYALAPSIEEVGGSEPGIQVTLPETGPTPYASQVQLNFGAFGDTLLQGPFDDGFWSYADEGAGYDGEALVTAQTIGADGRGFTTRQLVQVGAPPGYPVRPTVTATAADGDSVDVSWSIPQSGDGVAYWTWDVYSVDQPGEYYLQSYFVDAENPFAQSATIGGLEPSTSYDLYVIGYTDDGDVTYWGEQRLTTTSGAAVQGLTASPVPTITGGPRVGGTLTVTTGTWAPAPVALARQWMRDGVPIPGATGATYAPTVADVGAEISVRVTGSKTGYLTQSRTSLPTAPVVDLAAATPSRLAGPDRYATAAAISGQFPAGVPVVYLATGRGFPDALSAASAAVADGGPLLITEPNRIPTVIADELVRLDPARVVLVGGPSVVSTAVEQAVSALLPEAEVDRLAGADRFATSRAIARDVFEAGSTPIAYIATGRNFPDALAASAAAGADGAPVILVNGTASTLDSATRTLLTDLDVERVFIAGSAAVVSSGIQNGLNTLLGSSNVTRLAGSDRFATAVAINDARFGAESTVYFATGRDFPDALAGAALAGRNGAPLYVVPGTCVPRIVLDSMARRGATEFVKFGSAGVLSAGVAQLRQC